MKISSKKNCEKKLWTIVEKSFEQELWENKSSEQECEHLLRKKQWTKLVNRSYDKSCEQKS